MPSLKKTLLTFQLIGLVSVFFINTGLYAQTDNSAGDSRYYQENVLILDTSKAGERIIAVGEHGLILYSDDDAESWKVAESSVDILLTSVFFLNKNTGWATGHQATILQTIDGGKNWIKQNNDPIGEPLFDILFINQLQGVAIGAYGLYLKTNDGGKNWKRGDLFKANSLENDFHLYAIISTSDKQFYIAGESGTLLKSNNFKTWEKQTLPDNKTLFTLVVGNVAGESHITAAGIRGYIIQSSNNGASWQQIPSSTIASLQGGTQLTNGKILFGGLGGSLIVSNNLAGKYQRILFPIGRSISNILQISKTDLLISGSFGLRKTHVNISLFADQVL